MLSSNDKIQSLSEKKSYIRDHFYFTEIGLFGSFARNEQTDLSDIDILVEFEPETPNLYYAELELKEYLKKCFNREIDICSKKWIRPIFKPIVLKEAIYAE
jgi:predicted nucleotidyltransferase